MPPEITQYFAWLEPVMHVVLPLISFGGLVSLGGAIAKELHHRWEKRTHARVDSRHHFSEE